MSRRKDDTPGDSTQEIRLAIQRKVQAGADPGLRRGAEERRSGRDRRGWHAMPTPPFVDGQGNVVTSDRRKLPDRRVNNIRVRWTAEGNDKG